MNQLHKSSTLAEFQEGPSKPALNRTPSLATSHHPSNPDLHASKLEAIAREHSRVIKNNAPVIEQLECQRRFFKRICEKQKEKLQQIDTRLLREEYEQELHLLRQQRNKMHEILARLHEDAEGKLGIFQEISKCLQDNRVFLQQSLLEIEAENAEYAQILLQKREILGSEQSRLRLNAEVIVDKERIEEKYNLIREEISRRERPPQEN